MATATVRARGLNNLVRDFRKLDKGLARDVQKQLREIARHVALTAKEIAEGKGLRDSGALIGGIKPFYRGATAGVRDSATRGGYPYPALYEFGGRGGLEFGPRAFLLPALERDEEYVIDALDDMLGRLGSSAGFH